MEGVLAYITPFAGNFAPAGWAFCMGQKLNIADYPVLSYLLGNSFGGDNQTYFNLPDLRGRAVVGQGWYPPGLINTYPFASTGGNETVTPTLAMTNHSHPITAGLTIPCNDASSDSTDPTKRVYGLDSSGGLVYSTSPAGNMRIDAMATTSSYGVATPAALKTMRPFLPINYIICVEGDFPPRPDNAEGAVESDPQSK